MLLQEMAHRRLQPRYKAQGAGLVRYLRCQKQRNKYYASGRQRRGKLKKRVRIEQRPTLTETRQRLGDWDGSTATGRGHKGISVTLVGCRSRYALVRELPNREPAPVSLTIIETVRPHKQRLLTLAFGKGKEFTDHLFFGTCLGPQGHVVHPYHSW